MLLGGCGLPVVRMDFGGGRSPRSGPWSRTSTSAAAQRVGDAVEGVANLDVVVDVDSCLAPLGVTRYRSTGSALSAGRSRSSNYGAGCATRRSSRSANSAMETPRSPDAPRSPLAVAGCQPTRRSPGGCIRVRTSGSDHYLPRYPSSVDTGAPSAIHSEIAANPLFRKMTRSSTIETWFAGNAKRRDTSMICGVASGPAMLPAP